jgi:predicted alpha/beta-hydrolase family hydrolase
VHQRPVPAPRGALVLGHGAGGRIETSDLVAVTGAAHAASFTVVLIEQPYRVAGRRAPPRAPSLDATWVAVVEHLRAHELGRLPVVVGGRSSGARVACRTSAATRAAGVLCLAFPLRPPRRAGKAEPPSRLFELDDVAVPVLVIQGEHDRFGIPPAAANRTVAIVAGDHRLGSDLPAIASAASGWLAGLAAGFT